MIFKSKPPATVGVAELCSLAADYESALTRVDDQRADYLQELVGSALHAARRAASIGDLLQGLHGAIAHSTKGADYFMKPGAIDRAGADRPLRQLSLAVRALQTRLLEQTDNRLFDVVNAELRAWQQSHGIGADVLVGSPGADQYRVVVPGSPQARVRDALIELLDGCAGLAEQFDVLDADPATVSPRSLGWVWLRMLLSGARRVPLPEISDFLLDARVRDSPEVYRLGVLLREQQTASGDAELARYQLSTWWGWLGARKINHGMQQAFAARQQSPDA